MAYVKVWCALCSDSVSVGTTADKRETAEELETQAKSSKGNKSSFKQAVKQSFGSYPNQPASSQSACQASLLSG